MKLPKELHYAEKHLLRIIGRLNRDYNLIRPGDHILLAVSGGKDSLSMASLLRRLQQRAPYEFTLEAVTLDTGLPEQEAQRLREYFRELQIPYEIRRTNINETIARVVTDSRNICTACARFRRGILYDLAFERRAVLALGHHADDAMETLLMNVFFTGKLQAMPPQLVSDDGRNRLIRPLLYCREEEIRRYAELSGAPVTRCWCMAGCDLSDRQRASMKRLIRDFESRYPDTGRHILAACANCKPSNLMDPALWNFRELRASWESETPHRIKPAVQEKWGAAAGEDSEDAHGRRS